MCSQVCQDKFVASMIQANEQKTIPFFLDIGSRDPIVINNTYHLEKTCGWTGLSIDMTDYSEDWKSSGRRTPFLQANALTLNWSTFWSEHKYPTLIDYLSLDIDEAQHDLVVNVFPWDKIEFRVATIEHDSYRFGTKTRDDIRNKLISFGYQMIVQDVQNEGIAFEDWWISSKHFPETLIQQSWKNLDGPVAVQTISDFLENNKQRSA